MTSPGSPQPHVPANDWTVLDVPALGEWTPTLTVSIVIPAHDPAHLPLVLAALTAQSYPRHLIEVVVVDDGSTPAIELPDLRPESTRVVRMIDGWGRAAACQLGADHTDGDVLHWLDADVIPARYEVEAQMRWHHLIDYAVPLADKRFARSDALDHLSPAELATAVAGGTPPEALARGDVTGHGWVERILRRTRRLADAGPRAMRAHVGASASVGRDLFKNSGGMPVDLARGEDIVLGYRLREGGAVFVPDVESRCLHLGTTTAMRHADAQNRHNAPYLADKVPEFRGHRRALSRCFEVPYVEVVIPVAGASFEAAQSAVDAQLAGGVPDLVVTLLGDWSSLAPGRRPVLIDPQLDLRLLQAAYVSEPRVRFLEDSHDHSDATFRLVLPDHQHFPVGRALRRLLRDMEASHVDHARVALPHQRHASIERTAAAARARRTDQPWPPQGSGGTDAVKVKMYDNDRSGFVTADQAPLIKRLPGLATWS